MDVDTTDTGAGDMDIDVVVPFGPAVGIKAGFNAGVYADTWRIRGKYYDDYFKNTGKRPRYYNKLIRKRIKW